MVNTGVKTFLEDLLEEWQSKAVSNTKGVQVKEDCQEGLRKLLEAAKGVSNGSSNGVSNGSTNGVSNGSTNGVSNGNSAPAVDLLTVKGTTSPLFDDVVRLSPKLHWEPFHQEATDIRKCELVGKEHTAFVHSDTISINLLFVPAGKSLLPHAEDCWTLFHLLRGQDTQMAPSMNKLETLEEGSIMGLLAAMPKCFQAPSTSSALLVYTKTKIVDKSALWFSDSSSINAKIDFRKFADVESVYDDMAEDYENRVRSWGYSLPELAADALVKYWGLDLPMETAHVFDAGCGDGLAGVALKRRGFKNITGGDLSVKMLEIAERRDCYKDLAKIDLHEGTEYKDNHFDAIICVGTTIHLRPSALSELVRVVKPGGPICVTISSNCWPKYDPELKRMTEANVWKPKWIMEEPVLNLPGNPSDPHRVAKVYVYTKV